MPDSFPLIGNDSQHIPRWSRASNPNWTGAEQVDTGGRYKGISLMLAMAGKSRLIIQV